ncbi:MAG: hypothetical protein WBJ39_03070 [bacterium]|jgi:D-alanine--D-alanine ligase
MKSRILFLYNAVAEEERHGHYGECMTFAQAAKIGQALVEGGHQVLHLNLRSPVQLEEFLRAHGPFTIAFCIAEGFLALPSTLFDGTGTPWVRKILEKRGVPATHTSVAGMEVCRNKDETYQALAANNIRVPAHFTIRPEAGSIDQQLKAIEEMMQFPLFVKPCGGGNSIGISEKSIVNNPRELEEQVYFLLEDLGDLPILVETYLPGQEYTIGIIGNEEKTVLPILAFPRDEKVRSFQVKKTSFTRRHEQEIITAEDPRYWRLYKLAVDTFAAVGAQDILRIDVREDSYGTPMVIDVNGTPTLTESSSLPYMAAQAGFSYSELINHILDTALERVYGQRTTEITG